MPSLTPMFSPKSFSDRIDRFINQKLYKMIEVLNYVGEQFVTIQKKKKPAQGSYEDDTTNLRSSTGYIVALEGHVLGQKIEGKPEGVAKGKELLNEVLGKNRKGLVLIVCAGMEYGAAVESKNFDVISGGIPNAERLLKELLTKTKLAA